MIMLIWKQAVAAARRRPAIFLIPALLLAATDFHVWAIGLLDGAKPADVGIGPIALYVAVKSAIIILYLIASLRIAGEAESGLFSLSGRQAKWLGGMVVALVLALAFRMIVTKMAGLILLPLGASRATVIGIGIVIYLATFMYVQMRLTPAVIGVLLGDRDANLLWSWLAMKGRAGAAILSLLAAAAPLFMLHLGNNLIWVPDDSVTRAAVLLFDGFVMAALLQVSTAAYAIIYRKARLDEPAGGAAKPAFA